MTPEQQRILMGDDGFDVISGTTKTNPANPVRWTGLYALTDTVLAAHTTEGVADNALATLTLPAGTFIAARWTSVTLTSGTALLYKTRII